MKKILLLFAIFISGLGFSQEDAMVFFADKENVAASIANPISILTQAAIDRKTAQGIVIDERDVPLNETYKSQVENATGITVLAKSKWMNAVYVRGSQANINNLSNLPFVTEIEFADSSLNRPAFPNIPTDKFEVEDTQVNYNYGDATNQTEMLSVDYLHQQDYTGDGILVAFMDNGYPGVMTNPAYQTLRNEGRLLGSYDFVARVESPNGTGSHGAATFSDAAGLLDGQFVGTAPGASYYLFVTEDDDSETPAEEAYWVEALERADSLGVYVTNTSLGYQDFDNSAYDHQYEDLDGQTTIGARGANHAFDKGMITVTSAGNDRFGFTYVGTPADAPGAFTVGAVDAGEFIASFSSIGPTVDGRVKPDVMAQGESAAVVSPNGDVNFSNGTSFSSPIMAGAVASLWQAVPNLKNDVVMQAIRESADRFNNPSDEYGYGIPNFENALNALLQLGYEDHLKDSQFALFPNPVSNELNISFPKSSENAQLSLYNVLGERILQTEISLNKNRIDVSYLKSGMYIASITSNNKTTSYKIIKE
ncbi:S8 family peptidase [Aequorivita echinoideorum]|uniref:S8 family peptidase n=1 Tax=Aequorivita echinoideorum TaxID=1549647 RepID=A0ABS5S508_9FLAO|nr:S8 family peptidase [Aequorivita echinoideorum]MBT0608302.1 S8 family peptidase [Aequorivita echinoideorum]